MKKPLVYMLIALVLGGACTENAVVVDDGLASEPVPTRLCASHEILEAQLRADPKLRFRMEEIETNTREFIASGRINERGKIEIPVVVNVLYRTDAENISEEQIQSQIDVLTEDFNAKNADVSKTPSLFKDLVADTDLQFVLEKINRKYSSKRSWDTNDDMKKSSRGGIDPTSPSTNLNIWIVNKMVSQGQVILGYAQFPGGNPATDGVVVGYNYFGRVGTLSAPYNKGRTATHEVGHWLNLRHIWGDQTCGDDLVADTPNHNTPNFGCPSSGHRSSCSGSPVEMTMNYMDYTDDACMYMFTLGQKARARALFSSRGARAAFAPR